MLCIFRFCFWALDFDKRFFAVHPIQNEPYNSEGRYLLCEIAPVTQPVKQTSNKYVADIFEIENMNSHIDENRVHSDYYKAEGPLPQFQDINNEVEDSQK